MYGILGVNLEKWSIWEIHFEMGNRMILQVRREGSLWDVVFCERVLYRNFDPQEW